MHKLYLVSFLFSEGSCAIVSQLEELILLIFGQGQILLAQLNPHTLGRFII